MQDRNLDELIEQSRQRVIPPCPAALADNVLRRVRLAREERQAAGRWLDGWLPRPALGWLGMAVAVFASVGTSALAVDFQRDDRPKQARVALGFDSLTNPVNLPTDHK